MRFASLYRKLLPIAALLAAGAAALHAQQPINPRTQVRWPTPCTTTANMFYSPYSNTCLPAGTAANPAGTNGQYQVNPNGIFGAVTGAIWQGTQDAQAQQSGAGHNGIVNSLGNCASLAYACSILAPALYSQAEAPPWGGVLGLFTYPTSGPTASQPFFNLMDQRFGSQQEYINYGDYVQPRLIYAVNTKVPLQQFTGLG